MFKEVSVEKPENAEPRVQTPSVTQGKRHESIESASLGWLTLLFSMGSHTEIKQNIVLITRAVHNLEPRFTARVLRTLTGLRRRMYREALSSVVESTYPSDSPIKSSLIELVGLLPTQSSRAEPSSASITQGTKDMEIDEPKQPERAASPASTTVPTEILPEVDVYIRLLVLLGLIDVKELDKAFELASETTSYIQQLSRRSMDHLAAKLWFYYARTAELIGNGRDQEIRPILLAAHSTASLRHDEDSQATLLNLLLRSYFTSGLYDQADKLVSKTTLPESAGNPQLARYLYYLGRLRAIQLNYSEAHTHLLHAIRRAPSETTAPGFIQTVYKFFIVVELLMGDIPDRSLFRRPLLRQSLASYFQLVQAVRIGDLASFSTVLSTHSSKFTQDGTLSLILRLRHNVIKTALRMISLSYSRISLRDITLKLHLDSEDDTEYIIAKSIRDGVIDAEIDHEKGWMKSKEVGGVYETDEPAKAFGQRVDFLLGLHNESVKAMRYALNADRSSECQMVFF